MTLNDGGSDTEEIQGIAQRSRVKGGMIVVKSDISVRRTLRLRGCQLDQMRSLPFYQDLDMACYSKKGYLQLSMMQEDKI